MALQNKDDDDVLCGGGNYKMPEFKGTVSGSNARGNGRTILRNAYWIANDFGRPGYVFTIFVQMHRHTAALFHDNTGACTFAEVIRAAEFSTLFEKFIKKFVQCYDCKSLETEFIVSKSQIASKCGACGHVSDILMREMYKVYIREKEADPSLKNLSFEDCEEGESEGKQQV